MIWDILILATIETGLGLLDEMGFGDSTRDLRDYLLKIGKRESQQALQHALNKAVAASKDDAVEALLTHRFFQEEVVRALLDPQESFNVQVAEQVWGEEFLKHVAGLRRFFVAMQMTLYEDSVWGWVFERYQDIRFQHEIRAAFHDRDLPTSDAMLVNAVSRTADSYRAKLNKDGAIAQGPGAKAVGAEGMLIEGDVHQIVQITLKQFIKLEQPGDMTDDLSRHYLRLVADQANNLGWIKVATDYSNPSRDENLPLADLYIDLDVTETRHAKTEEELRQFIFQQYELERIPVQDIVNQKSRLLIMGEPGSGKSTFVSYLAYLMAQARIDENPSPWLERLIQWEHEPLLPVHLELRQVDVAEVNPSIRPAKLLLNILRAKLDDWNLQRYWSELHSAIHEKKSGVLFLLDGLDEVTATQRHRVVDAINDLCALYPNHRYIVTCRPYAYLDQSWSLSGFHEVTLAPFDEQQIDQFIENWYGRLIERGLINQAYAREKSQHFKETVRQRGLLGLAMRPILLAVMAQLHAYTGKLPDERTQIFAEAIQLLLQRWEGHLKAEEGIIKHLNIPGLKMSDLEAGLYEVAYRAHNSSSVLEETTEITEGQLREWLSHYINNDWNKAGDFISYIRERAGLLIRYRANAYAFPHRSFQEFLSACYWLGMDDYPSQAAEMTRSDWDRWHEVFLLSVGYAAHTKRLGQAIAAVNFLLPRPISEVTNPKESDWRTAILAGQALLEIGLVSVQREQAGKALFERTQTWLVHTMRQDNLNVRMRIQAGSVLGKLGDPRRDVLTVDFMRFCLIPSGEFVFGLEKNQKVVTLPKFWMSRYPVTNAQFNQFMEADGYRQKNYWEEAIAKGVWKDGQLKDYRGDIRDAPPDLGEPFNLPNHPIVGITWYEAMAFVHWLDEHLRELTKQRVDGESAPYWQDLANAEWCVSLPDETQWEKAARGQDGRMYPWQGDLDINKANTYETGINSTSAVGCFPSGASPFRVLEMSGNVWEWTATEDSSFRILRGGSYYDSFTLSRCAYREVENPKRWEWSIGFRIAIAIKKIPPDIKQTDLGEKS